MADELEEVEQRFRADLADYVEPIEAASANAEAFAEANEAAAESTRQIRDAAAEAVAPVDGLSDAMAEEAAIAGELGYSVAELRDKQAQLAAIAGEAQARLEGADAAIAAMGADAEAAADAVGSLRDREAEAAAAAERMGAEVRTAGLDGAEASIAGATAMDEYRDKLAEVAATAEVAERAIDGVRDAETEAALAASAATDVEAASFEGADKAAVLMGVGIAVLVLAAAPVVAGFAAAGAAVAAFGVLGLPVIEEIKDALDGTAKATGPLAEVVREVDGLKQDLDSLSKSSGVRGDILGDIPEALGTAENLLAEMMPLAQAGARSFREIENAVAGWTSSAGFETFISTMAKYAPEATQAILNLAGALGGDIGTDLENLAPHAAQFINELAQIATELNGPLDTALVDGGAAAQGLMTAFGQLAEPTAKAGDNFRLTAHEADGFSASLAKTAEIASGPVGMIVGLGRDLRNLVDPSHGAAAATAAAGRGMSLAAAQADEMKNAVTSLSDALSKYLDPAAEADQAAITYRNDLATLNTDLRASGDQIGLGTQAMRDSFSAYVQVATDAEAYSKQLLDVNHNADGARRVLENAIGALDATGVHSREAATLVHDLTEALDSIPRLVDVTIATHYLSYGDGSTGGGTYGHKPIPGNEAYIGAGAGGSLPRSGLGSGADMNINVKVEIQGMSGPAFEQQLARHIQSSLGDFASRNSGSFIVLPGKRVGS